MAKTESKRIVWWVEHPDHPIAIVAAPNWEQATVEAASWWGVPWGRVAALCSEQRREELPKFVCADCRAIMYGRDGNRTRCALCENVARNKSKRDGKRYWRELRPR